MSALVSAPNIIKYLLELCLKHNTFLHIHFKQAWMFVFARAHVCVWEKRGYGMAILPYSPDMWRIQEILSHAESNQHFPNILAIPRTLLSVTKGLLAATLIRFFHFCRGVLCLVMWSPIFLTCYWKLAWFLMVHWMLCKFFCTSLLIDSFDKEIL